MTTIQLGGKTYELIAQSAEQNAKPNPCEGCAFNASSICSEPETIDCVLNEDHVWNEVAQQ